MENKTTATPVPSTEAQECGQPYAVKLVSAAPDLYEALYNTTALLKAFVSREDDIARATLEQAEAALAKASPATVATDNGTPPKTDETKSGTPKGGTP